MCYAGLPAPAVEAIAPRSPPERGLVRLERHGTVLSTRMFMVEEGDAWSWKKDPPMESIGVVFHRS